MKRRDTQPVRPIAACLLPLATVVLLARGAAAQHPQSARSDEPIAEVRVEGNRTVPTQKIMAEIKTQAGLPPDRKLIDEDIRRLNATRQFFDVAAVFRREPHGLVLVYRVLEGNQIGAVVFEGNQAFSSEKLREKAGLKDAKTLDIARAKEAARLVEDHYHTKGYSFARVEVAEGSTPGDRRLVFRIVEGPKVTITDVDFEFADGKEEHISARRLATQVKTKPRRFGFFGGKYNGRDIDDDVHKLTAYYQSLGFFDVKVSREVRESDDRSKVQVLFVISEGQQFHVRSVAFTGNQKLGEAKLREGLKLVESEPYNQARLQADVQNIQDKYGALGHIDRKVEPDVRFNATPGEVDLVYRITEGEPYYVGRILISGNHTTKDNVIRRELRLAPGDLADTTLMRRSERNLRGTQLFVANHHAGTGPTVTPLRQSTVTLASYQEPTGEGPNLREGSITDVAVQVQEAQTGHLLFGVGVNSDAGLIGNIVISEQNFDLFRWPATFEDFLTGDAFRGGGQEFRLELSPGTQFSRYVVSWREPRVFDLPYSFGVSGYFFQRNYREWDEERAGGSLTLGHSFTDQIRGSVSLRIENVEIDDPHVPTPPDLVEVLGSNFLTTVNVGLEHDTRDNPFIPSCGHLASVAFEQGFGDFTYPSVTLEGRQHFTCVERVDGSGKQILSLRGTLGFAGDDTPIFERFYAGGFRNLRGFDFRGVGPSVFDTHVGGTFMMLGSVEYTFPITADDNLQLAVFSDFGTVEEDVQITDFRITAGLGLRVTLPIAPVPLAFDFAFPLHRAETDDEQIFSFFFSAFR